MDPEFGFSTDPIHNHAWPYQWYTRTINSPQDATLTHGFGYPTTWEYLGHSPSINAPQGEFIYVTPSGTYREGNGYPQPLDAQSSVVSNTGTVSFDGTGGATLTTGSPVMLTTFVHLAAPEDFLILDLGHTFTWGGITSVTDADNRYDTDVPYEFCDAVWQIMRDDQNPLGNRYAQRPGLYQNVQRVCRGYVEGQDRNIAWWKTV
jgi:hypothetical protein